MRILYILIVLILAASALGCVSPKSPEVTPAATPAGTPAETPASAIATTTPSGSDEFGTQGDINSMDSLLNDSAMDIPLSDATI